MRMVALSLVVFLAFMSVAGARPRVGPVAVASVGPTLELYNVPFERDGRVESRDLVAQTTGERNPGSDSGASRGEIVAWIALGVAGVAAVLATFALVEANDKPKTTGGISL